jgi:hypothetical protein
MKKLSIGDVTITSIIERDGPWRTPQEMFPAYDPTIGKRHVAELDSEVFDPALSDLYRAYAQAHGCRRLLSGPELGQSGTANHGNA